MNTINCEACGKPYDLNKLKELGWRQPMNIHEAFSDGQPDRWDEVEKLVAKMKKKREGITKGETNANQKTIHFRI